jgi:superfamily II DNA or RNA helicase
MTQHAAHVMSDEEVTEFFGEKPLRWYQVAARHAAIAALERGEKRILIVLPTGAGKTITVACTMGDPGILHAMKVTGRKLRVLFT